MPRIEGRIVHAHSRDSLPDALVTAFCRRLAADRPLGEARSNADGMFAIEVDAPIFKRIVVGKLDVDFTIERPTGARLETEGEAVWNARLAEQGLIVIQVRTDTPQPDGQDPDSDVSGLITLTNGVALPGVQVRAVDHNIGDAITLGVATTGRDGRYRIAWHSGILHGKNAADLQVTVNDAAGRTLVESRVFYQADRHASVDLAVAADRAPRPAEFERLQADLREVAGRRLDALDANGVTFLAGRTGWDARAVAMASRATALSEATRAQIPAQHYYALLRAGLPDDPAVLLLRSDEEIATSLKAALEAGVIDDAANVERTVELHRKLAIASLRQHRPAGAASSLGDLLELRLDRGQQDGFLAAYRDTGGDPDALWNTLRDNGFDAGTIKALQTDAELGRITAQNAPVVKRLTAEHGVATTSDLAAQGFYHARAWREVIANDIPRGVTAEQYADSLAQQVRLAQPTLVAADLVRRETLVLAEPEAREEVADFLASNGETALGSIPVHTWQGFDHLSEAGQHEAKRVERLYQISPSDEAMVTLSALGLDSARAVLAFDAGTFMEKFGEELGAATTSAVFSKAFQVHAATVNIATAYLLQRTAPNVYAINGAAQEGLEPPAPATAVAASLEQLMGSLDFCTCTECNSVLSPAAYLVELLEFLDVGAPPDNPLHVLLERRPDLQHLQLTCENTNVQLPYVDLVNEILEHYVVHGDLVGYTGHDTNAEAISADLLADPVFVLDAAYAQTKAAVWPVPLPFDMPLAHLRGLFELWDTTLAEALLVLGSAADARRERLALNAAEWGLLTTGNTDLAEIFGEAPGTSIEDLNHAISSGRAFARRTGLKYTEVADLLRCRFVNPGVALLPQFEPLGLTFQQVRDHLDGALSQADLADAMEVDRDAEARAAAAAWVHDNAAALLDIITLRAGQDADPCDFGAVYLRTTNPDPTASRLTELHYQRLHRFIRLWRTLGWPMDVTDTAVVRLLGADPATVTSGNLDATMSDLLARLANLRLLLDRRSVKPAKVPDWLVLWEPARSSEDRRDRLAGLLKVGTTDLANLIEITGFDPFADDLHTDDPSLLRLERAVAMVKASPLKVADIGYLLRHDDSAGTLAPKDADVRRSISALRGGLNAVAAELTVAPTTADLASAQAKAALVYDADTVAMFFGMVGATTTYSAPLVTAATSLPAPLADPDLAYDGFAQALTHRGVLDEAVRAALSAKADALVLADVPELSSAGELAAYVAALKAALQQLHDDAAADIAALGDAAPELPALLGTVLAMADPAARAAAIVAAILPAVRQAQRTASVLSSLVAIVKADPTIVAALASDKDVLPSDTGADPVIADLLALDNPVVFDADGTVSFAIHATTTDDYVLSVRAPVGVTVALTIDGAVVIPATSVGSAGEVRAANPVRWPAGALVPASLELAGLPANSSAQVQWSTRAQAKQPIPAAQLTGADELAAATRSLQRLHKAVLLQRSLGLCADDIVHLAAEQPATKGLLAGLDIDGGIAAGDLHDQWVRLEHALWFNAVRSAIEPEPGALAGGLRDPGATNAVGRLVLADMLQQRETDVEAVLGHLGRTSADLGDLRVLRQTQAALDLVTRTLQPAADLIAWTVADPTGPHVRGIVAALADRTDKASWQEAMKAVADPLRNRRRDALNAYVLYHHPPRPGMTSLEQLYEHFLVDVQMDACTKTSRIRLALSTVQLFVMRCLLQREPDVSPADIRADRWQWMKRYRVWEANRKIFLYPENWLEPELRDSKSPFFSELESDLLKADITDELAEAAYLQYLKKLDDVGRLDIVGAYLEQRRPHEPQDDVLHVIGRSGGTNRQHWYRRFDGSWSPWEKIGLTIDSDLVFPVVWRQQLFVFWFTITQKANQQPSDAQLVDIGNQNFTGRSSVDIEITLHWGELYRGRWTSPKSTEMRRPIRLTGLPSFNPARLVIAGRTHRPFPEAPQRLVLSLSYLQDGKAHGSTVTFTTKNAAPHVSDGPADDDVLNGVSGTVRRMWAADESGTVLDTNGFVYHGSQLKAHIDQPPWSSQASRTQDVISKTSKLTPGLRVRPLLHPTEEPFEAPFFYADEHSVFFVRTTEHVSRERLWYYVPEYIPKFSDVIPRIPPLYEKPAIPIPPDPIGPVTELAGIDPYVHQVMTTVTPFTFNGIDLGPAGPVVNPGVM